LQQSSIDLLALQQVEEDDFSLLQFTIASDCCTFNSTNLIVLYFQAQKKPALKQVFFGAHYNKR